MTTRDEAQRKLDAVWEEIRSRPMSYYLRPKPKPPTVDAATHNRRLRAKLAAERMVEQQRDIPAQRLQQLMDQAQQAYRDRLRERAEDDAKTCHRGSDDPDWRR
jgi:hypothetical protein